MDSRVTDMLFVPYPGSPFTVHVSYNYGQQPRNVIPLTPISAVTVPLPPQLCTAPSQKGHRLRAVFNSDQIAELEKAFQKNNYLTTERRYKLAMRIGLDEKQVKDWFQNRRAKARRNHEVSTHNAESTARREMEVAKNEIIKFLEGKQENNINGIMTPLLNAMPQLSSTSTTPTTTCYDTDFEDLLDILKREANNVAEISPTLQLKRTLTDGHENMPPPPQKKCRYEIPDQNWFCPQKFH